MNVKEYDEKWMVWRDRVLDIEPRIATSVADKLGDLVMEAYINGKIDGASEMGEMATKAYITGISDGAASKHQGCVMEGDNE